MQFQKYPLRSPLSQGGGRCHENPYGFCVDRAKFCIDDGQNHHPVQLLQSGTTSFVGTAIFRTKLALAVPKAAKIDVEAVSDHHHARSLSNHSKPLLLDNRWGRIQSMPYQYPGKLHRGSHESPANWRFWTIFDVFGPSGPRLTYFGYRTH
jgi:hypothetical protein